MRVSYGKANSKLVRLQALLGRKVYSWSILSGKNCTYAKDCKVWAERDSQTGRTRKVRSPLTVFDCFSASEEALYPSVYDSRARNSEVLMLSQSQMTEVMLAGIPKNAGVIRIHVGGDFKTQEYFDAWLDVTLRRPELLFYAYTKSIPFWLKRVDSIPDNFRLTASRGGHRDDLIAAHGLKEAVVVYTEQQAADLGLEIDHDDSHAALGSTSFALLIHGKQAAGTEAAAAVRALKGKGSYSHKVNKALALA